MRKKLRHPLLIGNLKPDAAAKRLARSGESMNFTNGVSVDKLPASLSQILADLGFTFADRVALALHGQGCVMPHTDDTPGLGTLVWLIDDNASQKNWGGTPSELMVAAYGDKGTIPMRCGDMVLFDASIIHAWITNSAWSMLVIDVKRKMKRRAA